MKVSCANHLQPLLHWGRPLQILGGRLDIPIDRFLRQIYHMTRIQRFAVLLEVLLILIQHTIEPCTANQYLPIKDDGGMAVHGSSFFAQ